MKKNRKPQEASLMFVVFKGIDNLIGNDMDVLKLILIPFFYGVQFCSH
jgi:hypothetical protein